MQDEIIFRNIKVRFTQNSHTIKTSPEFIAFCYSAYMNIHNEKWQLELKVVKVLVVIAITSLTLDMCKCYEMKE